MVKIGDTIRIISLAPNADGTPDPSESRYVGKTGKVTMLDSQGNLIGTWGGISLLAGLDKYEIVENA